MTLSITNATLVNNETIAARGYSASTTTIAAATAVALGFYVQCKFHADATAGATVAVAFSVLPGHQHYLAVVRNDDAVQSLTAVNVFAEPQVLS